MSAEEKPTTNEAEDFTANDQPVDAELADAPPANLASEETIDSTGNSQTPANTSRSYDGSNASSNSITEFFEARPADAVVSGNVAAATIPAYQPPPPLAKSLQNLSANGGAVGALVLGAWCFIGSFITNWSIINGLLGLILGFWGLTSRRQRIAWIGIALCLVGVFLSLADISAMVNEWMNPVDENTIGM